MYRNTPATSVTARTRPPSLPASRSRLARTAKRTAVATAGGTLVVGGVALLVLPGPGLLVIIAGLALLSTEFAWAERHLRQARAKAQRAADVARRTRRTHRRASLTRSDHH